MWLNLCITLALLATAQSAAAPASPWVATENGVGPIKIGMSVAEVGKSVGAEIKLEKSSTNNVDVCGTAAVPGHPYIELLFENRRLSRISFGAPTGIATSQGIANGASQEQVQTQYSPLEITAADEDGPPAHNLTWWARKDAAGIRFRTNLQNKVRSISVGTKAITYIEQCS